LQFSLARKAFTKKANHTLSLRQQTTNPQTKHLINNRRPQKRGSGGRICANTKTVGGSTRKRRETIFKGKVE
jgi:hypothetical protein